MKNNNNIIFKQPTQECHAHYHCAKGYKDALVGNNKTYSLYTKE